MLAFSGCYYGGGKDEKEELGKIRKRWKSLHVRFHFVQQNYHLTNAVNINLDWNLEYEISSSLICRQAIPIRNEGREDALLLPKKSV